MAERDLAPDDAKRIARVAIDSPLPHLDRPFDYLVPDGMSASARPGVRVKVRFGAQDLDAFILQRGSETDHVGRLSPIRRVVSAEPVLTDQTIDLIRAVADRYAGTFSDVVRLAVPPRHARTEKDPSDALPPNRDRAGREGALAPGSQAEPWQHYRAGPAFLTRLRHGEAPRAVWAALPGAEHWAHAIVSACQVVIDSGRTAIVVLPDRRDVDALESAVVQRLGPGRHARLEADLGASARYRSFLAALRGEVDLVIGTRSAAFAPLNNVGLVVLWDDSDESHAEPRAPYPHSREVVRLRAEQADAAVLIGGWTVSVESMAWVESGWAKPIEADRARRRAVWPRVRTAEDAAGPLPAPASGGLPSGAWRVIRDGLQRGSVLVQIPRTGYLPAVSCQRCRHPARCPACSGPVRLDQAGRAGCGWCGLPLSPWRCPECGGTELRARARGQERSAEELGRAFPGVPVVISRPERTLPTVGERASIVVATSGVEPRLVQGYAAAVLLDGDLTLSRPVLQAGEDALRRWLTAAALVRSATEGGQVVISAEPSAPAVQALVRCDPSGFAAQELEIRRELGLPPARLTVAVEGDPSAARGLLVAAGLVARGGGAADSTRASIDVLGPIVIAERTRPVESTDPVDDGFDLDPDPVRYLVRTDPDDGPALIAELTDVVRARSAGREPGRVRVRVDPTGIG